VGFHNAVHEELGGGQIHQLAVFQKRSGFQEGVQRVMEILLRIKIHGNIPMHAQGVIFSEL